MSAVDPSGNLLLDYGHGHGFETALYPPGATFGPRLLRDFEFVWIQEGDALYRWNQHEREAPQGAIVLCRPPANDFFRWDPKRQTRHAYFHFHLRGSLPPDWPSIDAWPLVRLPRRDDDLLYALFRHLLAWNGRGDAFLKQNIALCLLSAFVTGETEAITPQPAGLPDPVVRALAFVARTLDEAPARRISLADLASAACVTPAYLCRLFARATGQTPAEAVRRARLSRAITLLTRTNFTIHEIAHLTGFESPFHFSRLVKSVYGRSPRALRADATAGRFIPMTSPLL